MKTSLEHIIWFYIAVCEFIIILVVLLFRLLRHKGNRDINKFKSVEIDMDNLMQSIHLSKDLYKELSRSCHPDRFINTEKFEIAESIFQEISLNERNYKELLRLKDEAADKLFNK
ncbi:MAG: molecular chaperone DnaJ [Cryomorphaceae bacterium]|jgi:hypothetical protein|nr:molecular chaperone DnaJ [Cryomorphaceae bacterium]